MIGTLTRVADSRDDLSQAQIDECLRAPDMCWFDIEAPSDGDIEHLGDVLGLHPLAIEDSKEFGQAPKISRFDGYALIIGFGMGVDDSLVEVHCYYSTSFIVTLRRAGVPCVDELRRSSAFRTSLTGDPVVALYRVADALYGSWQPVIDHLDDQLTDVEGAVLDAPHQSQLGHLSEVKRRVAELRRGVAQAREVLGSAGRSSIEDLPGMTQDGLHYARDLNETVRELAGDVEELSNHASAVIDLHLSLTSNRQNDVMRQLTLVATLFLPMTFLVGFFGQNFSMLVNLESGWVSFIVLGILLEIVSVVLLLWVLRSRGWSWGRR